MSETRHWWQYESLTRPDTRPIGALNAHEVKQLAVSAVRRGTLQALAIAILVTVVIELLLRG